MSRTHITTGVAVTVALAVVGYFFIIGSSGLQLFGSNTQAAVPEAAEGELIVQDEKVGTGAVAKVGDMVQVHYTGMLANGATFDSSAGKAPIEFVLGTGAVIPGWDQGLQGMKVGGKRLLIIPPSLGYGAQGYGPIPANATLIFEVDLVAVNPPAIVPQTAN